MQNSQKFINGDVFETKISLCCGLSLRTRCGALLVKIGWGIECLVLMMAEEDEKGALVSQFLLEGNGFQRC